MERWSYTLKLEDSARDFISYNGVSTKTLIELLAMFAEEQIDIALEEERKGEQAK